MDKREDLVDEALTDLVRLEQDSILRLIEIMDDVDLILPFDQVEFIVEMKESANGKCALCPDAVVLVDVLALPWCEHHQSRGEFVNLMSARRWPELENVTLGDDQDFKNFSIASGAWFVAVNALTATDDRITMLALAALEYDEREVA